MKRIQNQTWTHSGMSGIGHIPQNTANDRVRPFMTVSAEHDEIA